MSAMNPITRLHAIGNILAQRTPRVLNADPDVALVAPAYGAREDAT